MKWNYRIIDFGTHLALHEVYYGDDGKPNGHTAAAITFVADPEEGPEGIQAGLRMALRDAVQRPALPVGDFPYAAEKLAEGRIEEVVAVYAGEDRVDPPATRPFDAAKYLRDPLDARLYIEAAMEGSDDAHLHNALEDVVRSGALHRPRPAAEPEINIRWSAEDQAWLATAVVGGEPIAASTSDGGTPSSALDALMEKRFLLGSDLF